MRGTWEDTGDKYKAFDPQCCSGRRLLRDDSSAAPVEIACSHRQEWTLGEKPMELRAGGGRSCDCSPARRMDIAKYEWTPSDCSLPEWDARAFCAALGNRTILFLGDSTGGQVAAGIANYVLWNHGGCDAQFAHDLSDTIIAKPFGGYNRGKRWSVQVENMSPQPDIVVLAAAAHIGRRFGTPALMEILTHLEAHDAV